MIFHIVLLLSHLWVSILALLSRELLEDCGQTAEHKDATVSGNNITSVMMVKCFLICF